MSMFIIPMAGLSSRFFKTGYSVPKYQLKIGNKSMFLWSVESFKKYFSSDKFIFICRDINNTRFFIKDELSKISLINYEIVTLDNPTLGQADTVYQGLNKLSLLNSSEDIYIFNIDSRIEFFQKAEFLNKESVDGYLEVFKCPGDHWSFVEPGENNSVVRTTEKERISDLCSDGLYYFKKISDFVEIFLYAKENKNLSKNELYIAPLFNSLISKNKNIKYELISRGKVIICGTPNEYEDLVSQNM